MKFLVFLEHHDGELEKGGLGVLSKVAPLGEVAGVVLGPGASEIAAHAGTHGATKAYACEDEALAAPLPQPRVDAFAALVEKTGADVVLFAASVLAADVAAGLATRLDAGLNWDLTDLVVTDGELVGKRPALGDTVLVDVGWNGAPRLGLIRAGAFDPVESGGSAEVESFDVAVVDFSALATLLEQTQEESSGPSIEEAEIIVAGGRGLGSPEAFSLLEELAAALGAPSRQRARSWTPAGTRTRRRSVRPGRPFRRSSTSRAASRARSSTRSGCRAPARSSPSTRTRTLRSSTSAMSASWATCIRSSPS